MPVDPALIHWISPFKPCVSRKCSVKGTAQMWTTNWYTFHADLEKFSMTRHHSSLEIFKIRLGNFLDA